jgi:hypothetical protein
MGSEFTILAEAVEHLVEVLDGGGGVVDGVEHGLHVGGVKFAGFFVAPDLLGLLPGAEEFAGEADEAALAVVEAHGAARGRVEGGKVGR